MMAADLLRQARIRRGLSQADVAARARTSQPVISAYENGHRDPSTATLQRLIAAIGDHLELRLAPTPPDIPPPASMQEHADRLLDVLLLADAIGHRTQSAAAVPTFPRIDST